MRGPHMVTNKDLSPQSYCYGRSCFNLTILVRSRCSHSVVFRRSRQLVTEKAVKITKNKTPLHPTAGRRQQHLDGDENERFSH